MTTSHPIKFSFIADFFRSNSKQLKKGEIAYTDGHVMKMIFDGSIQPAILKGNVQAGMKNKNYEVEILIDPEDGIVQASCSCPRGDAICHHMAALCIYGHYNVSSTDQTCTWNAPKSTNVEAVKLKDVFPSKKPDYKATDRNVTTTEINEFISNLEKNIVGFSWYLRPEVPKDVFILVPEIEDMLITDDFINAADKSGFLKDKLQLTEEAVENIATLTVGQTANEKWLVARKNRLTASKFGLVLAACRRKKFPPSLYKNLLEGYDVSSVKAIQWGLENEKTALEEFSHATGLQVTPTGLWLHKCGYLGASPDGLIGDDAVIEIKCPYKFRHNLKESLSNNTSYIIYKYADGQTKVNEAHHYWHQIQGQLYMTKRAKCHLVVWTPKDCEIVIVHKSPVWENNISILQNFYLNKFIPHLCEA